LIAGGHGTTVKQSDIAPALAANRELKRGAAFARIDQVDKKQGLRKRGYWKN